MGNTAKQRRLGLFQDSDFAGDLEDSKSRPGGTLCVFGSHTFVPLSWICKKQTPVSHSSTELEIISWMQDWGSMVSPHLIYGIWSSQFLETRIRVLKHWESCVRINVKLILHVTRFTNKLADILTKGNLTRDKWNHLLCLSNIRHFSSTNCSEVISKWTQNDSGEKRVTAKSKSMMNLVSRCSERNTDVLASTASQSPEKTRYESQLPLSSWTEQHLRTGRPFFGRLLIKSLRVESWRKNGLLKSENLMKWWK